LASAYFGFEDYHSQGSPESKKQSVSDIIKKVVLASSAVQTAQEVGST